MTANSLDCLLRKFGRAIDAQQQPLRAPLPQGYYNPTDSQRCELALAVKQQRTLLAERRRERVELNAREISQRAQTREFLARVAERASVGRF